MTCALGLEYYELHPMDENPSIASSLESESWMYIY